MPEQTSNHGYNRPDKGAEDWDVPLNENFKSLDADVLIRDAESNRSNYESKEGGVFLATDTGRLFLGDGTNWQTLGFLSPVQVFVQDSEPKSPETGAIWVDTS